MHYLSLSPCSSSQNTSHYVAQDGIQDRNIRLSFQDLISSIQHQEKKQKLPKEKQDSSKYIN